MTTYSFHRILIEFTLDCMVCQAVASQIHSSHLILLFPLNKKHLIHLTPNFKLLSKKI